MNYFLIAVTVLSAFLNAEAAMTLDDMNNIDAQFSEYTAQYGKKYDDDQLEFRKGLFAANLDKIASFNANDNNDYEIGLNQFSDLTAAERAAFTGLVMETNNSTNKKAKAKASASTEDALKSKPTLSGVDSFSSMNRAINVPSSTKSSTGPVSPFPASTDPASTTVTPAATTVTPAASTVTPAAATAKPVVYTMANIPKSVNLVTQGIITPVKNQLSCGGCYAFSAAALVESMYKRKFKTDIDLSEQQVIGCSSKYRNNGCNGGTIGNALNYIKDTGIRSESIIPYEQKSTITQCTGLNNVNIAATADTLSKPSLKTGVDLSAVNGLKGNSLIELLNALQTSPVAMAIYVADSLYNYKKGLYSASNCAGITGLNHAVLAVGYSLTGDASTNNKPYVLIKNSWSTQWGESGYVKMEISLNETGYNTCNMLTPGYNFTATML